MFRPTLDDNVFEMKASDRGIPAKATDNEKPILEKLLSLIQLVSLKYSIEFVKGRFDKKFPDDISVIVSNAAIIRVSGNRFEQESLRPILYLHSFGKCNEENKTGYPHLTSTVITINKDKIDDVMHGLNLLVTPTQEEAEDRQQARAVMAC